VSMASFPYDFPFLDLSKASVKENVVYDFQSTGYEERSAK